LFPLSSPDSPVSLTPLTRPIRPVSRASLDEATCLSGNSSGKYDDNGRFQSRRLNVKVFDGFASRGCNPRTPAAPFRRPIRKGLNSLWRDGFDPTWVVPERGEPAHPPGFAALTRGWRSRRRLSHWTPPASLKQVAPSRCGSICPGSRR
jgi:hypothetical protein